MNYFLLLVVAGVCGFAYYENQQLQLSVSQHQQDQQQITGLQQQLDDAKKQAEVHRLAPVTLTALVPVVPDTSHSNAIDAAATAATQATTTTASALGTITTLDGRTFQDCRILKVEADGVTFSHSEGITKVLFPLLRPELQQRFGYDPHKAVAQTDAQIRYQQQMQAASAASNPAPAQTTAPANP